MNTIVTSKEEILKNSRELIREKGWAAVSIRSVASACGVSVGSIYNYYDSKAELISATVESVWCEIFHRPQDEAVFQDVQTCVKWMYERMAYGYEQYPGFFTLHSLGFMQEDKADGKRHMQQIWHHILNGLCTVLQQDAKIRRIVFPHCCGNFITSKLNAVHPKGTLIGKFIAVSCCGLPALCGTLPASTSCALDAAMSGKPLTTVKTKTTLQKNAVLQSI